MKKNFFAIFFSTRSIFHRLLVSSVLAVICIFYLRPKSCLHNQQCCIYRQFFEAEKHTNVILCNSYEYFLQRQMILSLICLISFVFSISGIIVLIGIPFSSFNELRHSELFWLGLRNFQCVVDNCKKHHKWLLVSIGHMIVSWGTCVSWPIRILHKWLAEWVLTHLLKLIVALMHS